MYVALASVVALAVVSLAFAGLLRSLIRSHARERDLMVDKIMHLSGRTWTPPPGVISPEPEWDADRFVTSPEQLP